MSAVGTIERIVAAATRDGEISLLAVVAIILVATPLWFGLLCLVLALGPAS